MFKLALQLVFISSLSSGITGCGKRPLLGSPKHLRISGGLSALEGAWPWQVSIQRMSRHICGGSVISRQWVVTASHCFRNSDNYKLQIVAGVNSQSKYRKGVQYRSVQQVVLHENFIRRNYDNDVALLHLHRPLYFTNYVQPLCIMENEMDEKHLHFSLCYITGWGSSVLQEYGICQSVSHHLTVFLTFQKRMDKWKCIITECEKGLYIREESFWQLTGTLFNTLQEAEVDLIDTGICNQRSWHDGHVNDNMICAGFDKGGVDTCQGDSGGPLQCYSKDMERFYLYGVTSHGEDCALPNKPGIYTRASHYTVWLREAQARSVSAASVTELPVLKLISALFFSAFMGLLM